MKKLRFSLLCMFLLAWSINSFGQIKIVSGLEGGTYNHLANDISKHSSQPLEVLNSMGSMENFNLLAADNGINIGFMQYDVLIANQLINSKLKDNFRVFFHLFLDEEIHLISKKGSKIKKLKDLKGKKVAIGTPEQGTHVTALNIKEKTGIQWENIELSSNDAYTALLNGEIDAYFYVGGFPIASLEKLGEDAPIQLVSLKHKALKDIYRAKTIEAGKYKWQAKKVKTMAVPTLIVINTKGMSLDQEKMYNVLYKDIEKNVQKMQSDGHEKWKEVYFQNQDIDWPYYYVRAKVE